MAEALNLSGTVNRPYLPTPGSRRLIYLLLEVSGGSGAATLPINLALVVDVSESMYFRLISETQFEELARNGLLKREVLVDGMPAWQSTDLPREVLTRLPRKIDRVRDGLRAAVERLRPVDRFTLVAFAEQAVTLIPNSPASEGRRLLNALDELERLRLGHDTQIGRGMALGLEELERDASGDRAHRMLVLTDGFTLDEEACRAWAAHAHNTGIPISTLGLGGEFNEELMIPIADRTGGEAYLLETADEIPTVLGQELERAQAVQYRNLELKLRPTRGVEVRTAHRVRPSIAPLEAAGQDGSHSFPLGDLATGEAPAVLLELLAPPRPAGIYRLAQALLAWDEPASGPGRQKARSDIVIEYTHDAAHAAHQEAPVMQIVEALSAYKLQQRAQADLKAGNVAAATRKLRAAATRLLDMGKRELAAQVKRQATELEQRGRADPRRTKKLRYETRKLTRR